ncbi:gluconokinase [Halomonas denitrificans]|uniref:gluconokinase n=1 Tax=Halomonas TaxID=2745 RepID=UPI001CD5CD9E|nr:MULTISPECIES: gluconokinase [Halomonas]MCA0973017.1 gluconokinase [Halomonas denitrificans]
MNTASRPRLSTPPLSMLVMGVSGSGKSHIGRLLAERTGATFIDGDDYHSRDNIAKMSRGEPLNDEDRQGWLDTLAGLYREHRQTGQPLVIGCSALKRQYRDLLRAGAADLKILYLHGSQELLLSRLNSRGQHFFAGEHMLRNQLATLEMPGDDEAIRCDIESPPDAIIDRFISELATSPDAAR